MSGQWVVDVTDETFEKEVLERSKELPVVVDFWAEWCGPCRVLGPTLEKLAEEGAGKFLLAKVDTDKAQRVAQGFRIQSIPTVIAFKDGEPNAQFSGALPEDAVREFLAGLAPSEFDLKVERADALAANDSEAAVALYRELVEDAPSHDGANVGLAEALAATGASDDAKAILATLLPLTGSLGERVEHLRSELALHELRSDVTEEELRDKLVEATDNGDVLLQLGQLLAAEKRYPEALDALFKAAEADPKLATGRAKELMVDIFHVIGVRSEMADDYRSRLTRLWY